MQSCRLLDDLEGLGVRGRHHLVADTELPLQVLEDGDAIAGGGVIGGVDGLNGGHRRQGGLQVLEEARLSDINPVLAGERAVHLRARRELRDQGRGRACPGLVVG